VTSIELRNPTESQPIEITQFIFQSASMHARNDKAGPLRNVPIARKREVRTCAGANAYFILLPPAVVITSMESALSRMVLVVDDDPLVLDVTATLLEDLGCEVITRPMARKP
jgi:hypothetical protein